jgi:leucine dehydrogenase
MAYQELSHDFLSGFPDYDHHEKIVHITDEKTGLNAFIGIHNTNIGPSLGGCRMVAYKTEADAIRDVLRLSRGMTYKNAMAGLHLGGGKSVIIGNPYKDKTEEMMKAMGRAVESLGGMYITAEDSGTGEKDMHAMSTETSYVVGLPGGKGDLGGDPSPFTAWGVYNGLKAAVSKRYGSDKLSGLKVAVQGLGAVGYGLCRLLANDGVTLIATDIRPEVLEKAKDEFHSITIVGAEEIFKVQANVLAPCALGAVLDDVTAPQLRVDIIAGAANNQCAEPRHHEMLAKRGILYTPDYVLNAGGVISAAYEYFLRSGRNPFAHDLTRKNVMAHIEKIGPMLMKVFNIAESKGITPAQAADAMAESLFMGASGTKTGCC